MRRFGKYKYIILEKMLATDLVPKKVPVSRNPKAKGFEIFDHFSNLCKRSGTLKKSITKYVILEKARPYTRVRRGKLEHVKGYAGRASAGGRTRIGMGVKEFEDTTKEERMSQATWRDIRSQMAVNLGEIRTKDAKFVSISGSLNIKKAQAVAGNMRKELACYTKYLAGDSVDLMHKYVSLTEQVLEKSEGVSSEYMNRMCIDGIRKLVYQEVESNRQQFTDHGIRHIVKNVLMQNEMLDSLDTSGLKVSHRERLLANFVMINHDVGYTVPMVRAGGTTSIKASKEHPMYSSKIAKEQKRIWNVGHVFTEEEYNRALNIIATHDTTDLDVKDPVALATRISDNLSLFQEEKLPSMFQYVEGAERLLISMSLAAKKDDKAGFEDYRNQLHHRIDKSNFSPALKRDLKAATKELTFLTPKFTVGVLAGEVSRVGSSDKGLISVTIKHNKFDEVLQKMFDMGQRQVRKFLGDYGEKDFSKAEYLLGKYGDKAVLELKVEGAK